MNIDAWFFLKRHAAFLLALWVFAFAALPLYAQPTIPPHTACPVSGPNLIQNPEFDLDNLGINSSYAFNPDYVCDWGQYSINSTIVYDPAGGCYGNPAFDIRSIWAATDRNAPTTGNFMIVDPCDPSVGGASCLALNSDNIIWSQTVSICPSSQYLFYIHAKNLYYLEGIQYPGAGIEPEFQLFVNGERVRDYHIDGAAIEDSVFGMPQTSVADSGSWRLVAGTWGSDVDDSVAVLEVRNTQTSTGGNDLAIDGLYFGLCGRDVSLNQQGVVPQCVAENTIAPLTLQASVKTQNSDWGYYEWYQNDFILESDILLPGSPIPDLITPADPITNAFFGEYRLVVYPDFSPDTSCGNSSERVVVVDSCTGVATFPVEWLAFTAEASQGGARLHWSTASESQNQGFEVEMSQAGAPFETLGWVDGAGDSHLVRSYQYQTEPLASGEYLFRLRQVDLDGQSQYSPSVALHLRTNEPHIFLAPNPVKDIAWLSLSLPQSEPLQIDLFGLAGRHVATIYQGTTQKAERLAIDLSSYQPGMYFLQIRGSSFRRQLRVMHR